MHRAIMMCCRMTCIMSMPNQTQTQYKQTHKHTQMQEHILAIYFPNIHAIWGFEVVWVVWAARLASDWEELFVKCVSSRYSWFTCIAVCIARHRFSGHWGAFSGYWSSSLVLSGEIPKYLWTCLFPDKTLWTCEVVRIMIRCMIFSNEQRIAVVRLAIFGFVSIKQLPLLGGNRS